MRLCALTLAQAQLGLVFKEKPWPKELKTGTGARGFALLKTVPIWYELWRQINGFPPDYYKNKATIKNAK